MNKVLDTFEFVLKRVYDEFYDKLISDNYFSKFFSGRDVEDIKRRQIKNLIFSYHKFLEGNIEEIKKNYIQLAKLHDKLGLDFNSYMDALSDLELLTLKEFFSLLQTTIMQKFRYRKFFCKRRRVF